MEFGFYRGMNARIRDVLSNEGSLQDEHEQDEQFEDDVGDGQLVNARECRCSSQLARSRHYNSE